MFYHSNRRVTDRGGFEDRLRRNGFPEAVVMRKNCKSQRSREFPVKLCLLEMSEAT